MITYIRDAHDEGVTRRRLDDAWDAFREAADDAWEAHCAEKDYKSSRAFECLAEPMRTINALQEELIRYHERCDAQSNADREVFDAEHGPLECDGNCYRDHDAEDQADKEDASYTTWKDER